MQLSYLQSRHWSKRLQTEAQLSPKWDDLPAAGLRELSLIGVEEGRVWLASLWSGSLWSGSLWSGSLWSG
jgi:hypothetical protein